MEGGAETSMYQYVLANLIGFPQGCPDLITYHVHINIVRQDDGLVRQELESYNVHIHNYIASSFDETFKMYYEDDHQEILCEENEPQLEILIIRC